MSQKNPVFKKLAALTLSASVCTTAVGATTPAKKEQSNNNIIKYVGYTVVAGVAIGTATYLAWAKLFVNKVLAAAEKLAKELNKETPDKETVKRLSMKFYKLLHEATEDTKIQDEEIVQNEVGEEQIEKDKTEFGQEDYATYADRDTCREAALALIQEVFGTSENEIEKEQSNEENASEVQNRKIKVNRLRWVDRKKLKEALEKLFQKKTEDGSEHKSKKKSKKTSKTESEKTSTSRSSENDE